MDHDNLPMRRRHILVHLHAVYTVSMRPPPSSDRGADAAAWRLVGCGAAAILVCGKNETETNSHASLTCRYALTATNSILSVLFAFFYSLLVRIHMKYFINVLVRATNEKLRHSGTTIHIECPDHVAFWLVRGR